MKRTNSGSELAASTVTSSNKKIKQSEVNMSDSDAVMDGKATAEGRCFALSLGANAPRIFRYNRIFFLPGCQRRSVEALLCSCIAR